MGASQSTSFSGRISTGHLSERKQPLYLVEFAPGAAIQHWGLFLLTHPENSTGLLWELSVAFDGSSGLKTATFSPRHGANNKYHCRKSDWNMRRALQNGKGFTLIEGAYSTPSRIDQATQRVMGDFKYNLLRENCQSFIIDTLETLHRWEPAMVSELAVKSVKAKSFLSVKATTAMKQKKNPGRAEQRARDRGRFTSETENSTRRTVGRSGTQFYTPQSSRQESGSSLFRSDIEVAPIQAPRGNRLERRRYEGGARSDQPVRSAPMANLNTRPYRSEDYVHYRQVPGGWGY
jgi:hypothetical protein